MLTESARDILEELGWQEAAAPTPPPPDLTPDEAAVYAAIDPENGTLLDDVALKTWTCKAPSWPSPRCNSAA